jgi:hypothetical protein
MANFVPNIALGRVAELYNRVDSNDPTNAALIVSLWAVTGDQDASIRDADTLAAIEALGSVAEIALTNYARKVLTDADITAFAPDDANDRVDLDIPDQTWTALGAGTVTDLLIAYDNDTGAGTDSNIVPLTWHDFAVTSDGSDVTAQIATVGFYRASPV